MIIDELHGFYLLTTANCPTCNKVKEDLATIANKPVVYEINANDFLELAKILNVIGTPCLLNMKYGKEYDRLYGAPSIMKLEQFFQGE